MLQLKNMDSVNTNKNQFFCTQEKVRGQVFTIILLAFDRIFITVQGR